jgi:hypothetical protein
VTDNPEQPVLDAIDELVDWQIEEGRKREGKRPRFELPPYVEAFATPVDPEAFARTLAQLEELRALVGVPAEEPPMPEPGDRMMYADVDGTVQVGVVKEHREDPPGSGSWTITIGDDPRGSSRSSV